MHWARRPRSSEETDTRLLVQVVISGINPASCLAQCFCVFSNLLELCSVPLVGQQGPECWLASETETSSHGDEISTSVTFSPSSSPSPESRTPPRDHLLRAAGGVPLRYSKSDQIINVDWLPLLIE